MFPYHSYAVNAVNTPPRPSNHVAPPDHLHASAGGKRAYDVDDADFFWEACGAHIFPKVADEVDTQLQVRTRRCA